jgi:hypothetical protein
MKLEELLTLYQKEKPQLSPRTIQKYKSIITMFAKERLFVLAVLLGLSPINSKYIVETL